ncbi:MAG: hypothetical protein RBG13Loki_2660 [Promethearchaeota archaeon CR_4]|nr:MAG: hypothetical protein RBG13Loki_2660 [Candidatus Lokiarchaeota archaeon CR_4]
MTGGDSRRGRPVAVHNLDVLNHQVWTFPPEGFLEIIVVFIRFRHDAEIIHVSAQGVITRFNRARYMIITCGAPLYPLGNTRFDIIPIEEEKVIEG